MSVRQLAGICTIDGVPCHVLSMDVQQSATKECSTLHAEIAIDEHRGVAALASAAPDVAVTGEVEASFGSGHLFTGTADHISVDFDRRIMKVQARDKTKGMIEKKTTEDFRNLPASAIVSKIYGRHGLAPVVDGTADMAGKQQQKEDYVHLTHHESEWTLIQHLADREGKVAFVQKNAGYFVEIDSAAFGALAVVYAPPTPGGHADGNCLRLSCSRNFEAGKRSKCTVRSWNVKKKKAFTGEDQGGSGGALKNYEYSHPQLNQGQCEKIAKKRLREILRHEMTIEVEMVGNAKVAPPMRLSLSGTQTAFDQTYFVDRVHHRIGRGYVMCITGRNKKGGG